MCISYTVLNITTPPYPISYIHMYSTQHNHTSTSYILYSTQHNHTSTSYPPPPSSNPPRLHSQQRRGERRSPPTGSSRRSSSPSSHIGTVTLRGDSLIENSKIPFPGQSMYT